VGGEAVVLGQEGDLGANGDQDRTDCMNMQAQLFVGHPCSSCQLLMMLKSAYICLEMFFTWT